MRVAVEAIVTNEFNEVLLVQRSDAGTWAPPSGAVDVNELATEALAREVIAQTGLDVMPVRLVGVYYRATRPDGFVQFSFRCIQQGGQLRTSPTAPRVGFFNVAEGPEPMLPLHRERLNHALEHEGGAPVWRYQPLPTSVRMGRWILHRLANLRQVLGEAGQTKPPAEWKVGAFVLIRDAEGRILWLRRRDSGRWNLPGGERQGREAPWETAIRETREESGLQVRLTGLPGVYVKSPPQTLVFTFGAVPESGTLQPTSEASEIAYYAPGQEPENALPKHVERVADAYDAVGPTIFRHQTNDEEAPLG